MTFTAKRYGRTAPPIVEGKRVKLRPIHESDLSQLYSAAVHPLTGVTWRYRGATPEPVEFAQQLWNTVLAQFIVEALPTGKPLGLVTSYSPQGDRHAKLAVLAYPEVVGTGALLEGLVLLIEYVFHSWPFDKLYAESIDAAFERFASGLDRYFEVEGRLRNHDFYGGEPCDLIILAISRERWNSVSKRLIEAVVGGAGRNIEEV